MGLEMATETKLPTEAVIFHGTTRQLYFASRCHFSLKFQTFENHNSSFLSHCHATGLAIIIIIIRTFNTPVRKPEAQPISEIALGAHTKRSQYKWLPFR